MLSKVLLVEDDPTVRLILKKRLEASGYQVFVAEDGRQALDLVRDERIALIVSDWMMPEMDGLELCRRIKHDPRFHPNYFIMLTARGDKSDCIVGLEAGADDYLPKPIDEGELLARLKAGERQLTQQKSLKDLACTDPLTSLWNRRSFEDDLEREIAMSKRYHQPLSLLFIDIDLFKTINDHWGHAKGDEALKIIGKFLLQTLRRCDRAYRIGGDEFAVLLPQIHETEAEKASDRLKNEFADFMDRHRNLFPFSLTFSIGSTTLSPGVVVTKEQLIQAADKNMYLDKMARPERRSEQADAPSQSGTVLVVDDDPVTRMILQKGLSSAGYSVLEAEDGEACLSILKQETVDVLILDWILPGIDGTEVCARIRSEERLKMPYIILATIVGGAKSRVYALDAGADDYVNKPFDMDELMARVRVGMRMEALKRQIARVEKLEGVIQMAGTVAHDLSQPLTAIMGLADLLLLRLADSDPNYRYVQQILTQAHRLADLTKRAGDIVRFGTRQAASREK